MESWIRCSFSADRCGKCILVHFLMTREGIVVFEPNMFGMSYHFNKGLVSNLYTIYTVVIALNILAIMLHIMFTAKVKRYVYFAQTAVDQRCGDFLSRA